jgi:ABC-2 type transport system permease protein
MNPNRILSDFKVYGKQFARSREGMFFTFAFPIILILIFGAIFGGTSNSKADLYVQDLDHSPQSAQIIHALGQTNLVNVKNVSSGANATEYVRQNAISAMVIIPKGFGGELGKGGPSLIYISDPSSGSGVIGQQAIGVAQYILQLEFTKSQPLFNVSTRTVIGPNPNYLDFLIPGIIGLTIVTTPIFSSLAVVAEYRRRGIFKLLATTQITKTEWTVSRLLWQYVINLASAFLILGVGALVYRVYLVPNAASLFLLFAGMTLFYSLGILIGTTVKRQETAGIVGNVVAFPQMFLAATFFPITSAPLLVQYLADVLPLTYVNNGLRSAMIYSNNTPAVISGTAIFLVSIPILFLGIRAMNWSSE